MRDGSSASGDAGVWAERFTRLGIRAVQEAVAVTQDPGEEEVYAIAAESMAGGEVTSVCAELPVIVSVILSEVLPAHARHTLTAAVERMERELLPALSRDTPHRHSTHSATCWMWHPACTLRRTLELLRQMQDEQDEGEDGEAVRGSSG